MSPNASLVARSLGEAVGLRPTIAIVALIVVPTLVIGSTLLLCFYFFKARSSKRKRNRSASKSSLDTTSTDGDQEMALNAMGQTYRPPIPAPQQSTGFVGPMDRQVVAGHVKGAGSEVFDVHQYETERAKQRTRDMILPSPVTSPIRPRTAPDNSRPQNPFADFQPIDYNRPTNYESSTFNTYTNGSNQPDNNYQSPRLKTRPRSNSLGKPPPIRPPRPTHSPAGSVRSLSVFPHKHCLPNSPGISTTYQHGHTSPSHTPSPPLLTPPSLGSRSPPPARPPRHDRHPSIDRNSLMPIAPILMPDYRGGSNNALFPVSERAPSAQGNWEEARDQREWHNRSEKTYI